jgi:hypothetical protein
MIEEPQVVIETSGRSGSICYCEGPLRIGFDWEFGGTCVALIWGNSLLRLRESGAVSVERARDILRFVAQQVVAQKAPGCSVEIDEDRCEITVGRGR